MDDIISKIVINKKDKDQIYDRIEMELNLKIEVEKTKQLELIKDIRMIEKSIKEKELYCKRSNNTISDCESEYNSESDDDSSDDNNSEFSEEEITYKKDYDSISLCSIDSNYDIENEIEINY